MGRVPKIRFRGFTEDWEQQKAGDVLIERNVQHAQSKEFPLVSFTVENGVTPKVDRYEREQLVRGDKKAKKYKETRLDDIVYNPANLKFGAIARNKYGNAVFSPIYITYEVNDRLALPAFIEMLVTRNRFIQNALRYQQGTVYERMAVNTEDFAALDMSLPSVEEQSKIGTLFDKLDSAIFMYKRKLDETRTLKQYLLRNMFPAPGESVPAIRFEEFEGEWEQKKLSQLLSFSNGYNGSKDSYGSGIPYISVMDILENDYITYDVIRNKVNVDETTASRFLVFYGDVLFQRSSENVEDAGKSNVYLDEERPALFGGFVIRGKKIADYDPLFMKRNLETVSVRHQMQATAQGAQHINISQETLSEIRAYFPSLEEQQRIGTFFAELDENINYTKQKITALNTLKQYLLQNMFPTKG